MTADDVLRDIAASDRLVCVTGAGVSLGIPRAARTLTTGLPNWKTLLQELADSLGPHPDPDVAADIAALLAPAAPTGRQLVECATLLRTGREANFEVRFRQHVKPRKGATTATHRALARLEPRGVITFNYDEAHEGAYHREFPSLPLDVLTPGDETGIERVMRERSSQPFILKAHGTINDREFPLVLTNDSYREVLVRRPTYRAFVQQVLTECSLLIVGFGLSDPDFDVFLGSLATTFGSPLRQHVLIRVPPGVGPEAAAREVELRRRYGIYTIDADASDVVSVIETARSQPGPLLDALFRRTVDADVRERQRAHQELAGLGPVGRRIASRLLRELAMRSTNTWEAAEYVYSVGKLVYADPPHNERFLRATVESAVDVEHVAHALQGLGPIVQHRDLPQLRRWRRRFAAAPPPGSNPHRIVTYLDHLIALVGERT